MDDDVRNWLKSFGLQEYEEQFGKDGWETLDDIFHIDEHDLNACIRKPGHRKIFHLAVQETEATGVHASLKIKETNNEDLTTNYDENYDDSKAKDVEAFLQSIGLGHYISNFKKEGWDRLEVICDMDEQEVHNCIDKPGHRKKFQIALKRSDISSFDQMSPELSASVLSDKPQENDVKSWLEGHNLDQYFDRLVGEGWDTIDVLFKLGENEEDLKECIDKPGHRKRFQLAVISERSKENQDTSPKVKLPEKWDDIQIAQITKRKDIDYLQDACLDTRSDLSTVRKEFAASQIEPLENNNGSDKENPDAEGAIVKNKEDGLVQR